MAPQPNLVVDNPPCISLCLCVPCGEKLSCDRANAFQPAIEFLQGSLALQTMSLLAVPYALRQGWQQVERDVCWLKAAWIRVRDVMHE